MKTLAMGISEMSDHEKWVRKHLEGFRGAQRWPGWVFLPHGLDKDPKVLLSKKLWAVIFFDRQLIQNEKENPPC